MDANSLIKLAEVFSSSQKNAALWHVLNTVNVEKLLTRFALLSPAYEPPQGYDLWIILAVVIIITMLLTWRFVRRITESSCKIIMLGLPNAGKTVFLASMYYRLEVQDPAVGFFLDTDPKQREKLLIYRRQIKDASQTFPPANQLKDLTEWKFTCYAKIAGDNICTTARFTYFDYSGERINHLYQLQNQQSPEFQQIIDRANVLVGVLDGQELLNLMEGRRVREFRENSLLPILFILQRSKRPIHLIITKLDILGGKYSLADIRKRLEEYEPFKDFVATHRMFYTLRLIPVSALGKGVAELQPDGTMRKVPNADLNPYQIEMALACVLYDSLNDNLKKLNLNKNSRFFNLLTSVPYPLAFFLFFVYWLMKFVSLSLGGPHGLSFQIFLGGISFIDFLQASGSGGSGPGGVIQNRRQAIEQVIVNFRNLLKNLEQNFPESDLTNYNTGNNP